ncbi:MAG: DNA-directed RNA polymerase subunit omega [Paludibacteraceae bacterium]|nr:DNA-directed RNA polymerase subunit omega [Paludibacteraceae bacterium]
MDYKNSKAPHNTVTRDMNELSQKVGNVYETVAIISKRANQISQELKKELDNRLQDFNVPQENIDEIFENKEQIEISRQYELLPKPSLLATEEFLDDELTIRNTSKDKALEE